MSFPLPDWVPAEAGAAPALSQPAGPSGRVVVVLAGAEALSGGWAGPVTVSLAEAWAEAGARLVLADACLHEPQLHPALGLPLGEGLVDALRWGASVKRVAVRPEGRAFFVITAGTAVVDGAAVLDHPRWPALCAGFREAGVTLVVLTPAPDPGADAVLAQATDVVVLASPDEDAAALVTGWDGAVLGVLGRPAPEGGSAASTEPLEDTLPEAPAGDPDDGAALWGFDAPLEPGEEMEPASGDPMALLDDVSAEGREAAPEEEVTPAPTDGDDPDWAFEEPVGEAAGPEGDAAWAFEALEEAAAPLEDALPAPAWDEAVGDEDPAPQEWPELEPEPAPEPRDEAPGEAPVEDFFPDTEVETGGEPRLREPVPTFEEIVEESGEGPRQLAGPASRTTTWLLVLLLVVVGVLAAAWLGYVQIPGITPAGAGAAVAPGGVPAGAFIAASPPSATGEAQPFSVALGAFQDPAAAQAMVEELTQDVAGVLFVTAPVSVSGTVLHRVLAGPAPDSAGAASLLERVAGGSGLDASGWAPRATPKAFQLGEMPELDAASRRAEVLRGLAIPAYVLAVPYSNGSVRFRVYAGAYADEADASHLSALLQERGLNSASLTDRIGRLPE